MIVSFILIGGAVKGVSGVIVSVPVVGGITACGIFLLGISVWGIISAMKHHQVMLFVYMVVLFLIFIIQFSVSCAALGFPESSEKELIKDGWQFFLKHDNETIFLAESAGNCCGLENKITEGYNCEKLPCFDKTTPGNISNCDTCMSLIEDKLSSHFSYVGSIGLFFAFTEFIGMYIACRYRNMVDDGISTTAGAM